MFAENAVGLVGVRKQSEMTKKDSALTVTLRFA